MSRSSSTVRFPSRFPSEKVPRRSRTVIVFAAHCQTKASSAAQRCQFAAFLPRRVPNVAYRHDFPPGATNSPLALAAASAITPAENRGTFGGIVATCKVRGERTLPQRRQHACGEPPETRSGATLGACEHDVKRGLPPVPKRQPKDTDPVASAPRPTRNTRPLTFFDRSAINRARRPLLFVIHIPRRSLAARSSSTCRKTGLLENRDEPP